MLQYCFFLSCVQSKYLIRNFISAVLQVEAVKQLETCLVLFQSGKKNKTDVNVNFNQASLLKRILQ
jgi:hypothetical protein